MSAGKSLSEVIHDLSFIEFCELFGIIEDAVTRTFNPVTLWPAQEKICTWLDDDTWTEGLVLKARQLGISTLSGLLALKTAIGTPGAQVLIISKEDESATYYMRQRIVNPYKNLPNVPGINWPTIANESTHKLILSNGSSITSLSSSGTAGAGYTATLVIIDEAALIDGNSASRGGLAEIIVNIRPVIEKAGGKLLYISTAKRGSYFNKLVERHIAGKITDLSLFFLPANADPNRTQADLDKMRETYPSEADFLSQFPNKPGDVLMSREGLVFPEFEPMVGGRHVFESLSIPKDLPTYFILDHGYSHPTALIYAAYDLSEDMIYILGDKRWDRTQVADIAKDIHNLTNKLPKKPDHWIADAAIFSETGVNSIANVYRSHNINWRKSYKHKGLSMADGSLGMLASRFVQDKIKISKTAKNTIWQLANWEWDVSKTGVDKDKPKDVEDDFIDCVTGETLVTMGDGTHKPIRDITAGEYVLTMSGAREVLISGSTGYKEIWEIELTDGTILRTSAGHKTFTENGWVETEKLTILDNILQHQWENTWIESSSKDILTQDQLQQPTIIIEELSELKAKKIRPCLFTGQYGNITMVKYLMGIISTILTKTKQITTSPISNAFLLKTMQLCTLLKKEKSGVGRTLMTMQDQKQLNGISQKKVLHGINNTLQTLGSDIIHSVTKSVKYVVKFFYVKQPVLDSVVTIAGLPLDVEAELTTRHVNAPIVTKSSLSINTQPRCVVDTSVVENSGMVRIKSIRQTGIIEETFNLTVDEVPEYFANGLLVHNCARYLCADVFNFGHTPPSQKDQDAEAAIEAYRRATRPESNIGVYGKKQKTSSVSFDKPSNYDWLTL